jgi:hypothetical protein
VEFSFPDYDGKLIEFRHGGQKYYVTDVGAAQFETKKTGETTGMELFFVITFVGYQ